MNPLAIHFMGCDVNFVKIIPAEAGFYVLTTCGDHANDQITMFREPILAWAIDDDFFPRPITVEGVSADNACILQPDGTVIRQQCEAFLSAADWFKDQQYAFTQKKGPKI